MTLLDNMWMPTSKLDIEKTVNVLPPIVVAIFELGRWCFESVCAEPRIGTAEDSWHHVITLPPQYISKVSQWGDLKTDRAFIHGVRMWIALRLTNLIDKFVDSIQKQGSTVSVQGGTRSASSTALGAKVKYFDMPDKLLQQQKELRTTHEQIRQLEKANFQITYLEKDCSDYHLIEGVEICPEGALQDIVLP